MADGGFLDLVFSKVRAITGQTMPSGDLATRVQRAFAKAQAEQKLRNVKVGPDTGIWGILMPQNAAAVTNPFTGNVTYNQKAIGQYSDDQLENLATHELTHTKQTRQRSVGASLWSLLGPTEEYTRRPTEMEAFQAERDRSTRQKRDWTMDPITGGMDVELKAPPKPRSR